jgi:hypothetical protein
VFNSTMPPLKISMMLHFYSIVGAFAPDNVRRSESYAQFVRELLRDGMIERPSHQQREQHAGWAYRATDKGRTYVEALTKVPLPVLAAPVAPKWIIPVNVVNETATDPEFMARQRRIR